MLLCLVSLCAALSRIGKYCVAPHKRASPVTNMSLFYVQILFRHGHRTPLYQFLNKSDRGQWKCNEPDLPGGVTVSAPSRRYRYFHQRYDPRYLDYPPSCRMGDLTDIGMEQHLDLGRTMRQYLVDEMKFLPEKLDPAYVRLYSSPVDRCVRSLESFFGGLYPPQNVNEVLDIEIGSDALSDVVIRMSYCEALNDATKLWEASETVKDLVERVYPVLKEGMDILGLKKSYSDCESACGWAVAFNCSDAPKPTWLTNEFMEACNEVTMQDQYGRFGNPDIPRGLFGSYTLRKMLRVADEDIANAKPRRKLMSIFSAHDTTVAAVNVAMGKKEDEIPPYSANLLAEYWKDGDNQLWIRWVYNGEPIKQDLFGGETLVRLDNYRFVMDPLIDYCKDHDE